jgi:hypothetical protein
MLFGLGSAPQAATPEPLQFAQVTVKQQITIRTIRIRPVRTQPPATKVEWQEGRQFRCVPLRAIAGASILRQNSVDLILRNGGRIRARLGSMCPALDYYDGFYITPGSDGLICSDRELIRSRAGGQCEIDDFRTLRPVASD